MKANTKIWFAIALSWAIALVFWMFINTTDVTIDGWQCKDIPFIGATHCYAPKDIATLQWNELDMRLKQAIEEHYY